MKNSNECGCGESYEATAKEDPGLCPECAEMHRRREEESREMLRQQGCGAAWSQTPSRFRATNPAHPQFNAKLWERVREWEPARGKIWLGMVGEAGTSKTRCGYLLARELAGRYGARTGKRPTVAVISGPDFNRVVLDRFAKDGPRDFSINPGETSAEKANRLLREAREADVLFFDELGKVRPTPATVDAIFALLDHRYAWNKVTVWTANLKPDVFCSTWPDEFGPPAASRIAEISKVVTIRSSRA